MPKHAVIYARISPRPKAKLEASESIEGQISACEEWANGQGIPIRGTFSDKGISGKKADRPGLHAALAAMQKGDVLLVFSPDRLVRGVMLSCKIEDTVTAIEGSIHTLNGFGMSENDTPFEKLIRTIIAAFNEYSRAWGALITKQAMLRKQEAGIIMGSRLIYGMKRDPENPKMHIKCPIEQSRIDYIMRLRAEGMNQLAMAKFLNAKKEGRGEGRAQIWHQGTIGKIIARRLKEMEKTEDA